MERYDTFTVLIAKISRSIRKIKSEEMKDFGLQGANVSCLYYLFKANGTLTAKELCDLCEEDKAVVSRSIDTLEKDGYISCESKTDKRYKSPLTLTEKGMIAAKDIAERTDKFVDIGGMGINDEQRKVLYDCLFVISDNLQNECRKYGEWYESKNYDWFCFRH